MSNVDAIAPIYEAAFDADRWPFALKAIADKACCDAGALFCLSPSFSTLRVKAFGAMVEATSVFVAAPAYFDNARTRLIRDGLGCNFRRVAERIAPEVLARDVTTAILRDAGLDDEAYAVIPMHTGEIATFTFERALGKGSHDRHAIRALNAVLPHLARSSFISARLGLESAKAAVDALHALGVAAAVLDRNADMIACNEAFGRFPGVVTRGARVAFGEPHVELGVRQALDAAEISRQAVAMPMPATARRPAFIARTTPLVGRSIDMFSGGRCLLTLTPALARRRAPSSSLLGALFGLSPAEARTAHALARGDDVHAVARAAGVREKTVRVYIERINEKIGVRRLSELLVLLNSIEG